MEFSPYSIKKTEETTTYRGRLFRVFEATGTTYINKPILLAAEKEKQSILVHQARSMAEDRAYLITETTADGRQFFDLGRGFKYSVKSTSTEMLYNAVKQYAIEEIQEKEG